MDIIEANHYITECREVLRKLLNYVGDADCHGTKCRLPHCYSCNEEQNADKANEDLKKIVEEAKIILGDE